MTRLKRWICLLRLGELMAFLGLSRLLRLKANLRALREIIRSSRTRPGP